MTTDFTKTAYGWARNAHILAGIAAVTSGVTFLAHGGYGFGLILLFAALKEGWWDQHFETPIERGNGWQDFAAYAIGATVALIAVVLTGAPL